MPAIAITPLAEEYRELEGLARRRRTAQGLARVPESDTSQYLAHYFGGAQMLEKKRA